MVDKPLPSFVSAGEALTDFIRQPDGSWRHLVGGAGWNVARVVSTLGLSTGFAGAVSTDLFGQDLWEASAAAGLDLRFLQRYDRAPLLAMVYETDPPRYFFIGDVSADLAFAPARLPEGWTEAVKWAHFGGISLARRPLADTLVALAFDLKRRGVKISYDPNHRAIMDESYLPTLERMSRIADVIKVSDADLQGFFGASTSIEDGLARLRGWNTDAALLLTCGDKGATLYADGETHQVRPPRIVLVDTVGAGDASIGGLLYSLTRHPDAGWKAHLAVAVATGTAACQQAGATPPTRAQVEALLDI